MIAKPPIRSQYIEQKRPGDPSHYQLKIPAARPITFRYTDYWLLRDKTDVITKESAHYSNIEIRKSKQGFRSTRMCCHI